MLSANFKPKEQLRHCAVFLRQHGFLVFTAITMSTVNHFSEFLAGLHRMKFATTEYIISSHYMVCVTTVPYKIWMMTLFMFVALYFFKKFTQLNVEIHLSIF